MWPRLLALLACGAAAAVAAHGAPAEPAVPDYKFAVAEHHDTDALLDALEAVHDKCGKVTRLYSLGDSVEGRPLAVIEFGAKPGEHEPLKPEFKYIANMHGNEVIGRELLLDLANHMCDQYLAGDKSMVRMINTTRVHLMPSMNPDGYELAASVPREDRTWTLGRENANNKDLNRDFPDLDTILYYFEQEGVPRNDHLMEFFRETKDRQPETTAVGQWILSLPFVLSANLHEGDLVSNYPFDLSHERDGNNESPTPDDATFKWLAASYASKHPHMAEKGRRPCDGNPGDDFASRGGITNGARWYSVKGGMQDFNYLATNDFEITLELGCEKFPPAGDLPQLWADNKEALIHYMWMVHTGVKGLVLDAETGEPLPGARIYVLNATAGGEPVPLEHPVESADDGDYWRLLTAGNYAVIAQMDGYETQSQEVTVENKAGHEAARVDFKLQPVADGSEQPSAEEPQEQQFDEPYQEQEQEPGLYEQ